MWNIERHDRLYGDPHVTPLKVCTPTNGTDLEDVHKCREGMKTGHEFGPEIIGHEKNHALKDIWGSLGRKKNHAGSVGYRPVLLRESCPPRGMENALSKSIRGCDFYSRNFILYAIGVFPCRYPQNGLFLFFFSLFY